MPLSVPRFGNLAQYFCKQPLALGHESGKHRPSEGVVSPFYKISKSQRTTPLSLPRIEGSSPGSIFLSTTVVSLLFLPPLGTYGHRFTCHNQRHTLNLQNRS